MTTRFLVVSFDTDWRFPTPHSTEIARVLGRAGCDVICEEVASPWGHDSFLLEVPRYHELVSGHFVAVLQVAAAPGAFHYLCF